MNHGIFLCANCATGIHQEHYPVEVSYVKAIEKDEFNYLQLRVFINGGNKAAFDFFEVYDLQNEPVQKRYNTLAAQFYRDKLRDLVNQAGTSRNGSMPAIETGRQQFKADVRLTNQVKPFSELNNREILLELLSWQDISADKNKSGESNQSNLLLSKFDKFMQEKED